jgi:hypothetical protein
MSSLVLVAIPNSRDYVCNIAGLGVELRGIDEAGILTERTQDPQLGQSGVSRL